MRRNGKFVEQTQSEIASVLQQGIALGYFGRAPRIYRSLDGKQAKELLDAGIKAGTFSWEKIDYVSVLVIAPNRELCDKDIATILQCEQLKRPENVGIRLAVPKKNG